MTWSKLLYKSTINSEKNNKKKERKISKKVNKNKIKIKKRIVNSQWIKNTSTIEKQIFSKMIVEKKNYVFIAERKSIKLKNAEVYNKKNQWKHEHE